jgi:symplekin
MNQLYQMTTTFTKEVLAGVIQDLLDLDPMPALTMRTILQALSLFPALNGFIMNVLHRLIGRQVWTQPKLWEGFVKCCQKTKPQCFQVLLHLPPDQLRALFIASKQGNDDLQVCSISILMIG